MAIMNSLTSIALTIALFAVPLKVNGAVIANLSPQCMACGNCTLSDFLIVVRNLINAGVELVGLLSVFFTIIGGIILLLSAGQKKMIDAGKKAVGTSVKGLVISLSFWLIVNTVITFILDQGTLFGKEWFSIATETNVTSCELPIPPPPTIGKQRPSSVAPSDWKLNGIDPRQVQDASNALTTFINCLYTKVDFSINSISDDDLYTGRCALTQCNIPASKKGSCLFEACSNNDACVHRCGSCHYSYGTNPGTGFSNAVDIREYWKYDDIQFAAEQCGQEKGSNVRSLLEQSRDPKVPSHIHVEIDC